MINQERESGLILLLAVIVTGALTLMGLSLISQSTSQYTLTTTANARNNALYTAEAGIERSIQELNVDSAFAGYTSTQEFFDNSNQGYGTYVTTITPAPGNANAKVITSTGKIHRFSDHTRVIGTQVVQVTVVGTGSDGYSVITGPGGLILNGSANITNSPIFVGGTITLNGASKIGTSAKPLQVDVSNKACPLGANPGASYPTTCTSSEPLSLAYSTAIYGSVCATGQTSTGPNNNIKTGSGGQGLIVGCTAPDISTPSYDKTAHVASVTTTGSGSDNTYVCNSWPFDRVWPANLKLTGNVTIASSCNLTIKGDVYITGNFTIGGAASIKVDDSVGAIRPNILVDGKIDVGGSASITANGSGTGAKLISYASNAACGSNCSTLTGTPLKSTSNYETVKVGGAVNVPGVIFDAHWGKATISGSGNVGSATGQTVDLSGAGTITFGTVLATGSSTWTITSYQIKYP